MRSFFPTGTGRPYFYPFNPNKQSISLLTSGTTGPSWHDHPFSDFFMCYPFGHLQEPNGGSSVISTLPPAVVHQSRTCAGVTLVFSGRLRLTQAYLVLRYSSGFLPLLSPP